ncbi:MAG: DUF2513 domain-containing protein [Deltaproteobacteria bacterium]|nr:DUF2513 domain-containing protein [Deltaproteobacteria bacterium]
MKLNTDLIREILLQTEATEPGKPIKPDIPGYGEEEIGLHVEPMIKHGLIEGLTVPNGSGSVHRILAYRIDGITLEGQNFLNDARNDTNWKKAKEKCLEATGGVALDLLKACLAELAKQTIGRL